MQVGLDCWSPFVALIPLITSWIDSRSGRIIPIQGRRFPRAAENPFYGLVNSAFLVSRAHNAQMVCMDVIKQPASRYFNLTFA